jgi:deoxyribodipyrimidine photo-lyase
MPQGSWVNEQRQSGKWSVSGNAKDRGTGEEIGSSEHADSERSTLHQHREQHLLFLIKRRVIWLGVSNASHNTTSVRFSPDYLFNSSKAQNGATVSTPTTLVWLRDDLRVSDNPALLEATRRGAVVVVYLLDDLSEQVRPLGAASRWWLYHSLTTLAASLEALGGSLVLRRGRADAVIPQLVEEIGATAVHWNRRYSAARDIDAGLKSTLREKGIEVTSFQGSLLFEPWTVTTGEGTPYRVFTPFWKACQETGEPRQPLPAPDAIVLPETQSGASIASIASDDLDSWNLLPATPDWAGGLRERWVPGEASAAESLDAFADDVLIDYHRRDEPAHEATSHLSPHLRFGEISPFQVWHRVRGDLDPGARSNAAKFLSEIGWREFNWSILYNFPALAEANYRPDFDAFPWENPEEEPHRTELAAWKSGDTGIPLVDAGMRELWQTGYMHNRVRMVTASFLIKNLLIDWRVGEKWFWDCLVDADEASNPGNWQWVAGSGADAAPYFRIFNPLLQEKKFDPRRTYISRWIPSDELYPQPIVDLAVSRREALAAYDIVKNTARRPAEAAEKGE